MEIQAVQARGYSPRFASTEALASGKYGGYGGNFFGALYNAGEMRAEIGMIREAVLAGQVEVAGVSDTRNEQGFGQLQATISVPEGLEKLKVPGGDSVFEGTHVFTYTVERDGNGKKHTYLLKKNQDFREEMSWGLVYREPRFWVSLKNPYQVIWHGKPASNLRWPVSWALHEMFDQLVTQSTES